MKHHAKTIGQLKDLIAINTERIKDYQAAIDCLAKKNCALTSAYSSMIAQSLEFNNDLEKNIIIHGGNINDHQAHGVLYQKWKTLKNDFEEHDKNSSKDICMFCEDALATSLQVLANDLEMERDLHELFINQRNKLEKNATEIKQLLEETIIVYN